MTTKFWTNSFVKFVLSASTVASLCFAASISIAQTSDPTPPDSTELPADSDDAVEEVTEEGMEPETTEEGMDMEPEATDAGMELMAVATEAAMDERAEYTEE
ncbi:MAG: hypothetical protein ACFB4I_23225, partial [Cyanophyceae cyanobacterium]